MLEKMWLTTDGSTLYNNDEITKAGWKPLWPSFHKSGRPWLAGSLGKPGVSVEEWRRCWVMVSGDAFIDDIDRFCYKFS